MPLSEEEQKPFVELFEDTLCVMSIAHDVLTENVPPTEEKHRELVAGLEKRIGMYKAMLGVEDVDMLILRRMAEAMESRGNA